MNNTRVAYLLLFLLNALVMAFEMIGPRILAPYFGVTSLTWMCMIGTVLVAISSGYFLGSVIKLNPLKPHVFYVLIATAILLFLMNISKHSALEFMNKTQTSLVFKTLTSCLLLFFLPTALLSVVSVVLTQSCANQHGIGRPLAISTLGALFGLFFSGLVLIPFVGTEKIVFVLSALCLIMALLVTKPRSYLGLVAFVFVFNAYGYYAFGKTQSIRDEDSFYQRMFIYQTQNQQDHRPIKVLQLNNYINAAVYTNDTGLVYAYNQAIWSCIEAKKEHQNILFLGGAALSLPTYIKQRDPSVNIDVVEIDPKVIALAKAEFSPHPDLHVIYQDARVFLNLNQTQYDVVVWDLFTSLQNRPDHLCTIETAHHIRKALKPNGLVLANILDKPQGDFLASMFLTYKSQFIYTDIHVVDRSAAPKSYQNLLLVSSNKTRTEILNLVPPVLVQSIKPQGGFLLSDDYSPFSFLPTP